MSDDLDQRLRAMLEAHHADLVGTLEQLIGSAADEQSAVDQQMLEMLRQVLELVAPPAPQEPTAGGPEDYPALFMCPDHRALYVKPEPTSELNRIPLPESLYELFRLIVEFLQADANALHWSWGFVIWQPWEAPPSRESQAFSGQCTRFRHGIEEHWGLGRILGVGGGQGHFKIPIEATMDLFCTGELPQSVDGGTAYPVWELFVNDDLAKLAYRNEDWPGALQYFKGVQDIDPDNFLANMMATKIAMIAGQPRAITHHPAALNACAFVARKLPIYKSALSDIQDQNRAPAQENRAKPVYDQEAEKIETRLRRLREAAVWFKAVHGLALEIPPEAAPLPWRSRQRLEAWCADPSTDPAITKIQFNIRGRYTGQQGVDAEDCFREYVTKLALTDECPLPRTSTRFYRGAKDYVGAFVFNVPGNSDYEKIRNYKNICTLYNAAQSLGTNWDIVTADHLSDEEKVQIAKACGWHLDKLKDVLALTRHSHIQRADMDQFSDDEAEDPGDDEKEDDPGGEENDEP